MVNAYHRLQKTQDGIHIPYSFEYASEVERTSASNFTVDDNGKLALQRNNHSLWMLVDYASLTWMQVGLTTQMTSKIASVESGAEVNQNTISTIRTSNAIIEATKKTDKVSFEAGVGINIYGDAASNNIIFSTIGHSNSHLPGNVDTIVTASSESAGLMSSEDKIKLNKFFPLVAGEHITLTPSDGNLIISLTGYEAETFSHHALTGLNLDDHPQYLNTIRHTNPALHILGATVPHDALYNLADIKITNPTDNQILTYSNGQWVNAFIGANGSSIWHRSLIGLTADDHPQYLTLSRHNLDIHQFGNNLPHDALGQLADVALNEIANNQILSFTNGVWTNKNFTHTHNISEISGFPGVISHSNLTHLNIDDHKQYIHTTERRNISASHIFQNGFEMRNISTAPAIFCQPTVQSSLLVYRGNISMDAPVIDIISTNNPNAVLQISRINNGQNNIPCVSIEDGLDNLNTNVSTLDIQSITSVAAISVVNNGNGGAIYGRTMSTNQAAIYARGVDDTSPGLSVIGTTNVSSLAGDGNRAIYANSEGILTPQVSDQNLKTNIIDIAKEIDIIETIKQLHGVCFNWDTTKAKGLGNQREIGLLAQEVEKILPMVVGVNFDNSKSVDYSRIVVLLIEAIKIQQDGIEKLENAIKN